MLDHILRFDERAVGLVESALEFLSEWFAVTWKGAAEVLVALTLTCGVTWAWHEGSPGQVLLMLLAGLGMLSLVVAGQQRTSLLFRSREAALARTLLLPLTLSHISYFLNHEHTAGDGLLAVADWSALLLFYLLAAKDSDGERGRRRTASWERIKALFGTGWAVAPAPAEK